MNRCWQSIGAGLAGMGLAAMVLVAGVPPARAQSPSVDDLIRDLKPRADQRTRGIRPVGPAADTAAPPTPAAMPAPRVAPGAPPHGPAAAPRAAAPPVADAGQPSASMLIQFDNGSDRLTYAAKQELDKLGKALSGSELSGYRFRIEGHTDAVGSRELNALLSARRAAVVVDYVAAKFNIDRSRLTPVGMGYSQMAVPTQEGVPEPRNRRVQIVNIGT